jgi:hypothetical protein
MDKVDLTDIYRIFYPKATEYTFVSAMHRTFSKIDRILEHKASLNKFNNIEIISYILSDYLGIKLGINKRNYRKYPNTWRLNNLLLNDQYIIKKKKGRKF